MKREARVYFKDQLAGYLVEDRDKEAYIFSYDRKYLQDKGLPISYTLALSEKAYICKNNLHPFFDNLIAEGWLEKAQSRLLGKVKANRFDLLCAFGFDCIGAVSVFPEFDIVFNQDSVDINSKKELSLMTSRASLSGVQAKLGVVKKGKKFYPCVERELSSHIAKFASMGHANIVVNEYLTGIALSSILNKDKLANMKISYVEGISEEALLIERFDRNFNGEVKKIHFEEFNQLFNQSSDDKYNGSYESLADFIDNEKSCMPLEKVKLFERIIVGFLIGNTDMHMKNFAMLYTEGGLRLSPNYDQVCAYLYDYKNIALEINGAYSLALGNLKAKHILNLAKTFGILETTLLHSLKKIEGNIGKAITNIEKASVPSSNKELKTKIIEIMEKRWQGTFALIGKK